MMQKSFDPFDPFDRLRDRMLCLIEKALRPFERLRDRRLRGH